LKEPEGYQVDAPQQLNWLCYCPVSTRGIAYMWEGAAGWSTQLCWVATGLSRWMGCSDPQGSGRGRESI